MSTACWHQMTSGVAAHLRSRRLRQHCFSAAAGMRGLIDVRHFSNVCTRSARSAILSRTWRTGNSRLRGPAIAAAAPAARSMVGRGSAGGDAHGGSKTERKGGGGRGKGGEQQGTRSGGHSPWKRRKQGGKRRIPPANQHDHWSAATMKSVLDKGANIMSVGRGKVVGGCIFVV